MTNQDNQTNPNIDPEPLELDELQAWTADRWPAGTFQGDLAREDPKNVTDDEHTMLICLYEGYLKGQDES